MWSEEPHHFGVKRRSRYHSSPSSDEGDRWSYHLPKFERKRRRNIKKDRSVSRSPSRLHADRSRSPRIRGHLVGDRQCVIKSEDSPSSNRDDKRSHRWGSLEKPAHWRTSNNRDEESRIQPARYTVHRDESSDYDERLSQPACHTAPDQNHKYSSHDNTSDNGRSPIHQKTIHFCEERRFVSADVSDSDGDNGQSPSDQKTISFCKDRHFLSAGVSDISDGDNGWSPRDQKTIRFCEDKHFMSADMSDISDSEVEESDEAEEDYEKDDGFDPDLYCELCGISVTSADQMQTHYDGQKHKKKMKRIEKGEVVVPHPQNSNKKKLEGLEVDPNALTLVKCIVCKAELFNNELGPHIDCESHKEAEKYWLKRGMELPSVRDMFVKQFQLGDADAQVQLPDGNDAMFVCTLCDVSLSSLETMRAHFKGKKHLKKVKQSEREKNPQRYHCGICNISCNSSKELSIHRKGKKHIARAAWKDTVENTVPPTIGEYTVTTSGWKNSY